MAIDHRGISTVDKTYAYPYDRRLLKQVLLITFGVFYEKSGLRYVKCNGVI